MPSVRLEHFLGAISSSYRAAMEESERRMQWSSLSIRKEGREVEIAQLQKLYHTLLKVHEQSNFSDPHYCSRLSLLCAAEVFEKTGVPAENDGLLTSIGNSAQQLLDQEVFSSSPGSTGMSPCRLKMVLPCAIFWN